MRNNYLIHLTAALLAALFISCKAHAEEAAVLPPPTELHDTPAERQTIETSPPAEKGLNEQLVPEKIEGAEVRTYTRPDGSEITEHSVHGRVYMIKVQPPGGLPAYYLYDENGDGAFERRLPGNYKHISPPTWVLKKF